MLTDYLFLVAVIAGFVGYVVGVVITSWQIQDEGGDDGGGTQPELPDPPPVIFIPDYEESDR